MDTQTESSIDRNRADGRGLFSWALYDWANSAFPAVIQTFVFAYYFRSMVVSEEVGHLQWGLTVSFAGLVIALMGPVLGSIADRTGQRKPWIGVFTLICVVASALLWFVYPDPAYATRGLVLLVIGTLGSEGAFLFYNAMLPSLVSDERMGRWSGWGWGLGYAGGLACLVVALVFGRLQEPLFHLNESQATRATFVLVAVWYLIFALPLFLYTPDVPSSGLTLRQAIRAGWHQLVESIRKAKRYQTILRFLIARMLYVDGLATLFLFGGYYATEQYEGLGREHILILGVSLNVMAGLGAATFAWLDDRLGSKATIQISLAGLFLPTVAIVLLAETYPVFWALALVAGIFVGPVQAASRTYMAHSAPPELCNEMFGLFALSGKMTSFLGPLLVSMLASTFSLRLGMIIIPLFFLIGFAVLWSVPKAQRIAVGER